MELNFRIRPNTASLMCVRGRIYCVKNKYIVFQQHRFCINSCLKFSVNLSCKTMLFVIRAITGYLKSIFVAMKLKPHITWQHMQGKETCGLSKTLRADIRTERARKWIISVILYILSSSKV